MAIATYTIQFNEYELETILAAMDDYRDYDAEGMDPEDLIGRTPVLAVSYTHLTLPTKRIV